MKLILWIASLIICHHGMGNLLAPWVGPNIRLGEDPPALPFGDGLNQAEPHVTRSSVDPDIILATFQEGRYAIGGGAVGNGYAVSLDGGFTWKRELNPRLTTASGGIYFRATDPVAGIANDGTLYLNSLVSVDQAFGLGRIVLQRSFDHGDAWSDPIIIYSGSNEGANNRVFPDKNWMVVNAIEGSPTEGRIVVTWTDFRTIRTPDRDINDYLIMASHSDDRGQNWSAPVFVTPPLSESYSRYQYQGSQPVFLPKGDLAIVYHNFSGSRIQVIYSPDGGRTFPFGADNLHSSYELYDAPNMRDGSFLPAVDVAVESGDLYVAYTSTISSNDTYGYIYFVRTRRSSPDIPGNSPPDWNFSPPKIISGIQPSRVTCTPTISVSPDGLRVTVFFYDNRNGSGQNDSGDFYCVQSTDGGNTWTSPFRLSDQTFPLNRATQTNRGYMLGDYYGMAAPAGADQAAVAVWVGTPLATADPWSARISNTGASVMESWLQANVSWSVRRDGGWNPERDDDRDGTPLIMEYILGQSPMFAKLPVNFDNGFTLNLIRPTTDPTIDLELASGRGDWPDQWIPSGANPEFFAYGEGFWDEVVWPNGNQVEQLRFRINDTDDWYLLQQGSPSRWVLDMEGDWVWSPWLGHFETKLAPWLYHSTLGWVYDLRGALFWPEKGYYLLPSPRQSPWIYTSRDSFIYLHGSLPWIYDTATSEWIAVNPAESLTE